MQLPRHLIKAAFAAPLLFICLAAVADPPTPDHIVIVVEENHSFSQVMGSSSAPYLNSLAQSGMSFTNFYGITHPSQPNYLQLFSGSNQGVSTNTTSSAVPFNTANLGSELISAGLTFGGYSQGLPAVGSTVDSSGDYVRRHNPWVNWQSNSPTPNQLPGSANMPFSSFPNDFSLLPKVSIVVPDVQNDMHDGSIAKGDTWLRDNIKPYADWAQTHNSLLVVTFDEDNSAARNQIPTVFSGQMVKQGTNDATWTLHNLLRTAEDMYGTGHAGAAANVRSIVGAFNSDVQTSTKSFRAGDGGYADAHDTYIEQSAGTTPHGTDAKVVVDESPLSQGLVRFDKLTGGGAGQVPLGATILSAKLTLLTGDNSVNNDTTVDTVSLHRMLKDWGDSSTWNSLNGGVSTDDIEAASAADFALTPNVASAYAIFDVTATVQQWINNPASNFGWMMRDTGGDGWRWLSSEALLAGDRPRLEITYAVPEPGTAGLLAAGFVLLAIRRAHAR